MKDKQDILDDYIVYPVKPNKIYVSVLIILGLYFTFFTFDLFFNIDNLSFRKINTDLTTLALTIILPIIEFVLLAAKKKLGWFISMVYFSFLSFASIFMTIEGTDNFSKFSLTIRQSIILILSTTLGILLITKIIRKYFGIKMWVSMIAITIAVCFALLVIFFG